MAGGASPAKAAIGARAPAHREAQRAKRAVWAFMSLQKEVMASLLNFGAHSHSDHMRFVYLEKESSTDGFG
jgi:hypothetical protein